MNEKGTNLNVKRDKKIMDCYNLVLFFRLYNFAYKALRLFVVRRKIMIDAPSNTFTILDTSLPYATS